MRNDYLFMTAVFADSSVLQKKVVSLKRRSFLSRWEIYDYNLLAVHINTHETIAISPEDLRRTIEY